MKWLSAIASFGVMVALTVSSSGCKKADQQTSGGNKFTLTAPKETTIAPGKTEKVTVKIARQKGFEEGDVKVDLSDLPAGVTADPAEAKITGKNDTVDITLKAAADAKEESKEAKATAAAGSDKAEVRFKVSVSKK